MGDFTMDTNHLASSMSMLRATGNQLFQDRCQIKQNIVALRYVKDSASDAIRRRLAYESNQLGKEIDNINYIVNAGNRICTVVTTTDKNALSDFSYSPINTEGLKNLTQASLKTGSFADFITALVWLLQYITGTVGEGRPDYGGYKVDSVLFDEDGQYGGDQGHMQHTYENGTAKQKREIANMVRKYYPNMSDKEAYKYVSDINSVGCGYVALCNSLFRQYEGRPDEFEKKFGIPMYKNGDLNYDELLLDLYVTTDKAGLNTGSNGRPRGTNDASRLEIMQNYLKDKGVNVTSTEVKITPENFNQYAKQGEIILGYRDDHLVMQKMDGTKVDIGSGGHAITVTGVTKDGRYIVSSWGEQYYIDPSDLDGNDTFALIQYN